MELGNIESDILFLQQTGLLQTDKKIVELGSGRGHVVQKLTELGYHVEGTDRSDHHIEEARKDTGVVLQKMDATKLTYEDESVELIISFDLFEHIPNVDDHLKEVKRVLQTGGVYAFGTPNKYTNVPYSIIKDKGFQYREYHCSLHTLRQLRRRLTKAGFDVQFVDVPLRTPYFLQKLRRHFGILGPLIGKLPIELLPMSMRTNFFVIATKL